MLKIYEDIMERGEAAARTGATFIELLPILRELPLEDFGLLLLEMPNSAYPALSKAVPSMAPADVQKRWTGSSGTELYAQTAAFTRVLMSNYARYRNRGLEASRILDFGVGYGRIFRMMYYFSDPEALYGVDAWDRSLQLCRDTGLPGNFVLSDRVPTSFPIEDTKIDLIFSFSVFTHLAPDTARASLGALRKHIADDGLAMLTFRPVEFWRFIDQVRGTNDHARLEAEHQKKGIAYEPHSGKEGDTYGDTTFDKAFFETHEWKLLGIDRSIADPYQMLAILEPA